MPVPPRGDPRRPLHLAARSTRVLAVLFLLVSTCAVPGLLRVGTRGLPAWITLFGLLFYIVPGAGYLVFSIYLKRRKFWAVVAALVLTSLLLLIVIVGGIAFFVSLIAMNNGNRSFDRFLYIPIAILGILALALIELTFHLVRSFESIKYAPIEELRGFEPVIMDPNTSIPPPVPQQP